jgi:hypothetical protein
MSLELKLQKKLGGFQWKLTKGKHTMATSAHQYPSYRALRLSLISMIKSIQADNFIVYDETDDAPTRPRKRS